MTTVNTGYLLEVRRGASSRKMKHMQVKRLCFALTIFRNRLWIKLLYWSAQAHQEHEGQKVQGPGVLLGTAVEVGWNFVKIWFGFAEKVGREGGHGCMGQRGGPTCDESGCNDLLEDGALAPAKLLMKAAASSLHLPAASVASTTKQQRWLLSRLQSCLFFFCAAATSPGCYGQRMRSPPRFIEGNQSPLGNGLSWGPKGFAVTTKHQDMVRAQFEKGKETIRLCQSICLYSSFCIPVYFLVSLCFFKTSPWP